MNVTCPRCSAAYEVDESRIPAIGLRMRCPKCGGSLLVQASGAVTAVGGAGPTMQGIAPPLMRPPPPPAAPPQLSLKPAMAEMDFGELDLPALAESADLPGPVGFVDLPAPASSIDLPAPKQRAAAPPPTARLAPPVPDAELDLPGLSELDLPGPLMSDLPAPFSALQMPTAKASSASLDFADIDLPEPAGAALPVPATAQLPTPSLSFDLPTPAKTIDLPTPVDGSDLPVARGGDDLPSPARTGGLDFGEVDLAGGHAGGDSMEFDGFPTEGGGADLPLPRSMSPGAEVDLVAPRGMMGESAASSRGTLDLADSGRTSRTSVPAAAPRARARKRRSRKFWQVAFLILLFSVIAGGVGLSVTPYGLFASNVLAPLLPRGSSGGVSAGYLRSLRVTLKQDTYADYRSALAEIRIARRRSPSDVPLRAYAAYVRYAMSLRFGESANNDRAASRLAETLDLENPEGLELLLAAGAREAHRNQLPRAESRVAGLTGDPDALALAGWIALQRGSTDVAEQRYGKLAQIEPRSARAAFGILRVKVARGDTAAAKAQTAVVLAINGRHIGARLELARLLSAEEGGLDAAQAEIDAILGGHIRFAALGERAEAYALRGRILVGQSRFGAGRTAFESALAADPRNVAALIGLGKVLLKEGVFAEAQTRFEAARRIAPDDLEASIGTAGALIGLDSASEAKTLLTGLGAEKVELPEVQYWLGRTEEVLDDMRAAEAAYRAALTKRQGYVEPAVRLATLLERLGRTAEAGETLLSAREHAPDTAEARATLGEGFAGRGQLDVAEVELRRALALDAQNLPAAYQLALVLRRTGRFDEARSHLDSVAARDPAFPGLALERGRLFEATGEAERALAMYEELLRATPEDLDLEARVGITSFVAGRLEDAERILRKVSTARPNSAEANHYLGRTLLSRGQASESTTFLRRAADVDGSQAEHHLYYGWALDETGSLAQAIEALDEAVRLDPESPRALWRRGLVRLRLGNAPEAKADLEKAVALSPDLAEAHAALGECLDRLRDLRGALREYQSAISMKGDVPEWQFRYGLLLMDSGREREARGPLEQAATHVEAVTPKPYWFAEMLRNLGTARRVTGERRGAIEALTAYLDMSPPDAPDRRDVQRELEELQ